MLLKSKKKTKKTEGYLPFEEALERSYQTRKMAAKSEVDLFIFAGTPDHKTAARKLFLRKASERGDEIIIVPANEKDMAHFVLLLPEIRESLEKCAVHVILHSGLRNDALEDVGNHQNGNVRLIQKTHSLPAGYFIVGDDMISQYDSYNGHHRVWFYNQHYVGMIKRLISQIQSSIRP